MTQDFYEWLFRSGNWEHPAAEKGGKGSGFFAPMHAGRPGKRGGSMPSGQTSVTEVTEREASHFYEYARKHGGITVRPTGFMPKSGFVVADAFSRKKSHEEVFDEQSFTRETILDYCRRKKDVLRNPRAHLGAWFDSESRKWYLDVSYVIENREEAIRLARRSKQIAIWDLANSEEVRL